MIIRRTAVLLAACCLAFCPAVFAAADGSHLELPKGATVAVVIFEDLQCPDCARVHPELLKAAKASDAPLVIRDFPITRHTWAFPAAVLARYFGTVSPQLEVEFRSFIFQRQPDIRPENLRQVAEQFAQEHGVRLPAQVDPDDRLKARVQADFDLGLQIGLEYVPLIFVIGKGTGAAHSIEVTDVTQLAATIDQVRRSSAH
jgi:protein-disulfide isomerase